MPNRRNQNRGRCNSMKVPQGQPKIARRFNGGCQASNQIESRRDGRKRIFIRALLPPLRGFSPIGRRPTVETVGDFLPPLRGCRCVTEKFRLDKAFVHPSGINWLKMKIEFDLKKHVPVGHFERQTSHYPLYMEWQVLDEARDYFRTEISEMRLSNPFGAQVSTLMQLLPISITGLNRVPKSG